jgi:hypothetical protein
MSNEELIAVLEEHVTCEWEITDTGEGIVTINFITNIAEGDE